MKTAYCELHMHSPYSFLDGGSEIELLVRRAAELGMRSLALTDHNSAAAAVKFTTLCRAYHVRPILGAELTMEDETHLTLLAKDRQGYAQLCQLITTAHTAGGRLNPHLPWRALGIEGWEVPGRGAGGQWDRGVNRDHSHCPTVPLPHSRLFCLSGCRRGALAWLIRKHRYAEALNTATRLRDTFGAESFFVELQEDLTPEAHRVNRELAMLAKHVGVGVVATNNVHYATREDFTTHDILRCIHGKVTREQPHPDRPLNAERYLKGAREMAELFEWCPEALENTLRIAEQCEDALPAPEDVTPRYPVPEGKGDADSYLRYLVYKGGAHRYGLALSPNPSPKNGGGEHVGDSPLSCSWERGDGGVRARIEHELNVITRLGYADYFLMCWEIVRWARKQGIRATGRGSAADSCVAYCLTLTDVDVIERKLPFARFLTPGKTPDIDIDFPSERRDDVFRYIVGKYGEEHTAMVCTFFTYWAKGAVRDVGKVLAIPKEALDWLSDNLSSFIHADKIDEAFGMFAELKPYAALKDRFKLLFECCRKLAGFPRHIGTHSSGIVISREPLASIAPIQPSARGITQIWELDKDDAELIGAIKFDVLSLRMLSAINDAERALAPPPPKGGGYEIRANTDSAPDKTDPTNTLHPESALALNADSVSSPFRGRGGWPGYDRIPFGDPATFKMMRAGKAVGTFQFESAAQMALAVILQPEHFEDLVASVALIRPGPVRGNVVSRFVACRNGWMRADMLHPCLAEPLAKTYGCVVFQEQVNEVVRLMTGCTDAEADKFRKSITRHNKMGTLPELREQFVRSACAYRPDFDEERAHALFNQIEGWAGYGFTEGHAASFALTGYRSAYLSVHHPAEFYAGLMNHQPMGYYNANSLAAEARRRGVQILPVDINASGDKCGCMGGVGSDTHTSHTSHTPTLQPPAIRLGLRLVSDLREEDIAAIVGARERGGPFASLLDFCARVPMHRDRLENLILAGAFDSLHDHRRGLLWRLEDTLGTAASYREEGGSVGSVGSMGGVEVTSHTPHTPTLPYALFAQLRQLDTPVAWEIDDFSAWDKFLWSWRLTGVCAECHVFAYLRDELNAQGILTAHQAQQQKHGARITVAGLNIRPHRPPTRSGEPVLFTSIEDETEILQATTVGEAILGATPVFLTSPAVLVRGVIERRGKGVNLRVEAAKPLRMQELAHQGDALAAAPPPIRTYTGTKIHAAKEERTAALV